MNPMRLLCTLLALAIACCLMSPDAAAQSPRPIELVPSKALVVVEVPDVPGLLERGGASAFARFYDDPRAAEFFAPLRELIENWRGRVSAAGIQPAQLRAFFKGSAVLVGMPTDKGSDPIEWVFVAQHNGDATILDALKAYKGLPTGVLEAVPRKVGAQSYTRVRVTRPVAAPAEPAIPSPGAPAPKPPKPKVLIDFDEFHGADLIIHGGTRERPIESVLRLFDPANKDRIENSGAYKRVLAELKQKGDINVFLDGQDLMKIHGRELKKDKLPRKAQLKPLALERFGPAGAALRLESGALRSEMAWHIPAPRSGVPALATLAGPTPDDPAALFPPGTMMLSTSSYPLAQAWPMAMQTLLEASPEHALLTQLQLASIEQATGVQIQRDLLDRLGSRVVRALLPGKGGTGVPVWLLDVREPGLFRTALNDVAVYGSRQLGVYQLDREERDGAMLWTIRRGQPSAPQGPVLAQGAMAGGWLVIAPQAGLIDPVIKRIAQSESGSLAETATYRSAAQHWPAQRVAQGWSTFRGLYRAIEAGTWPRLNPDEKPEDWGPFKGRKLPDDDVLNQYFGPATAWRSLDGEWMRMELKLNYAQ